MKPDTDYSKEQSKKLYKLMRALDIITSEVCDDPEFSLEDLVKVQAARDMVFSHWLVYMPGDTRQPEELYVFSVPQPIAYVSTVKEGK